MSDGLLRRVVDQERPPVDFFLDGRQVSGKQGDTVLTAILTNVKALRSSEFSASPRAGFCLMGACQDCWLWHEDGTRIRACSTFLQPGMRLKTSPGGAV